MATLNAEKYIKLPFQSFKSQNDIRRILMVDGGSSDSTINLAEELSESLGLSTNIQIAKGTSQTSALGIALQGTKEEYVLWVNSDEAIWPGGTQKMNKALELNHGKSFLYGDWIMVDDQGRFVRLVANYNFPFFLIRNRGCSIPTIATVFNSSFLNKLKFSHPSRYFPDWVLFLQSRNEVMNSQHVNEIFGIYTRHPLQISAESKTERDKERKGIENEFAIKASPVMRIVANLIHKFLKVCSGAFWREYKARKFQGAEIYDANMKIDIALCYRIEKHIYG